MKIANTRLGCQAFNLRVNREKNSLINVHLEFVMYLPLGSVPEVCSSEQSPVAYGSFPMGKTYSHGNTVPQGSQKRSPVELVWKMNTVRLVK
jgi:hypothetical protein